MSNNTSSIFLSTLDKRSSDHARNPQLNDLINELRNLLEPIQQNITKNQGCPPQSPVGLILGCPRSGTTLALQFVASAGFSYPSNLFTRFAYAPYIGILIQKLLFDTTYDYHGDFHDLRPNHGFSSSLGKSKGVLAPNECFHFWRRFTPNFDLEWLDQAALASVDFQNMKAELGIIEKGFGKPFFAKGLMFQYNLKSFYFELPFLFFLHITRSPLHVMQSILESRKSFYGSYDIWWSVKPKEYSWLKEMDVYHQIAGQVYFTEKAIQDGLANIPETHWMKVQYESFCKNPEATYEALRGKYSALECELPKEYNGEKMFDTRDEIRLPSEDIDALTSAYHEFEFKLSQDTQ